ncbi:MAG: serine/threonine-protein kinase [Planctomycetaceae bacterium]
MKFTFSPESRVLDGYTIKRAIYRGGFGEVYYALSDAGREVALKLLQNNTDIELRGVQQCLNLSHPNLVTIFDVREDADHDHWIIMEYVSGETLDAAVRKHPDGMPMEEVCRWLKGIAGGVGYLHSRGLVHRDLKPANVFSGEGTIKVGDVGLSKFITHSRRSAQTQSVGTVYYMAPEVAKGRYGKEVDVYALGVMLYEMLTGKLPFDGESTGEILMKHLTTPPDLTLLPSRVQPVIQRALEKDPEKRYQSIELFEKAFHGAVVGKQEPIDLLDDAFLPVNNSAPSPQGGTLDTAKASPLVSSVELGKTSPISPPVDSTPTGPGSKSIVPQSFPEFLWPAGRVWWGIYLLGACLSLMGLFIDWADIGRLGDGAVGLGVLGMVMGYVLSVIRHATIGPWNFESGQSGYDKAAIYFPTGGWQQLVQLGGLAGFGILVNVFDSQNDAFPFVCWGWGMLAAYLGTVAYRASQPPKPATEVVWDLTDRPVPAEPQFVELLPVSTTSPTNSNYRRLDAQPWLLKARWAEWLQSAALAPFVVAALTTALAFVSPKFFSNSGPHTANDVAFFGLSALTAVWGTMLVAKFTERNRPETNSKWLFALTGAMIGLAVYGLRELLMVDPLASIGPEVPHGLFDHIGERPLFVPGVGPTCLGLVAFFTGLLAFRAWPRQVDRDRVAKFRVTSVLMTAVAAWLWASVFTFPQVWGMVVAVVVSASVQVLSPWSAAAARRRHG